MDHTCRSLLNRHTTRLARAGVDAPRLSAELLLARALHLSRLELLTGLMRPVSAEELPCAEELLARRLRGEPLAYILGVKEFYGREFRVDDRVLIPRPETELIVDAVCEVFGPCERFTFLDIGVGSGALLASIVCERPAAQGVGTDLSPGALEVAGDNCRLLQVAHRVQLVRSNLGQGLTPGAFDALVSNPPYLSDLDMRRLGREVLGFEPRGALHAGHRGTELIQEVIWQASGLLRPGGLLLVEIGAEQGAEALGLLAGMGGCWEWGEVRRDMAGRDRVLQCIRCE